MDSYNSAPYVKLVNEFQLIIQFLDQLSMFEQKMLRLSKNLFYFYNFDHKIQIPLQITFGHIFL